MDHGTGCEVREALRAVASSIVMQDDREGEDARTPPQRLGLPSFDEVAVVEEVDGRLRVVAGSGPCIVAAVALETRLGRGPSTDAVRSGELVVSRNLGAERRWGERAHASTWRAVGLGRLVAAPLRVPGEPAVGAIVLAGRSPGIITADEVAEVSALAEHSSLMLTATVLRGREERAGLTLDQVRLVGMAVGVVMATEGLREGDALARLRSRSERAGSTLAETAAVVLTEKQMSFEAGPAALTPGRAVGGTAARVPPEREKRSWSSILVEDECVCRRVRTESARASVGQGGGSHAQGAGRSR